jgi:hypothetical protein
VDGLVRDQSQRFVVQVIIGGIEDFREVVSGPNDKNDTAVMRLAVGESYYVGIDTHWQGIGRGVETHIYLDRAGR